MSTPALVSVVTPVYNTAPYLAECIESVLAQSHERLEYIIVNNASTDGSGAIADRYAQRDSRIKVHHFDHLLPQVPNYNRAVALASPDAAYIKVLEADNWLFPECLTKMVALAEQHPAVGVVSAYNTTETRLRLTGLPLATTVVPGAELARMQLSGQAYLFGAPSTVLMRASHVRRTTPFYDEQCLIGEDVDACFRMLRDCDFGFVHQVLTFVRTQNDSILSRIKGFDAQALDRVVMLERHGRHFFDPASLGAVRQATFKRYYAGLAEGWFDRKGDAFWRFHREGLASVGLQVEPARLARALAREALSRLAHPLRTLQRLRQAG